jgi:hemoglobin
LQRAIDEGIAAAAKERSAGESAFILRGVIDRIRDQVRGKVVTLWQKLGGETNVRKVVDDFVALAGKDPKVDFFRGGKYKPTEQQVADLKQKLVEFVSQATGGPLPYTGKSMKEVHKGMGITEAQFNAAAADLKKALDQNGTKPADRDALLAIVGTTRKDIVEAKGGEKEEKKDGEKKEEKKDGEKKKNGDEKKGDTGSKVEGVVHISGKPLEGGKISFVPSGDGEKKPISGDIKEDGSYEVEGLPPGKYKIVITPPEKGKAKDAVPARFRRAETSGLAAEVKAGDNRMDFELQK